jgi:SAM-dependent methyltransferase
MTDVLAAQSGFSGLTRQGGTSHENYWFRRHEVAYLSARPWVRGAVVLDAGSGDGYGADILSRVARRVVALDSDADASTHAAAIYPDVAVTRGNLIDLPFADSALDAVVSLQVVEHLPDQPQFAAELARVLRPAGTLVMSTPNRVTFSPGHDAPSNCELSATELTELLKPHFDVVRMYGVHHGPRLRKLDWRFRSDGGLIGAQFGSPAATWHPALRSAVTSVRARDFHFTENNIDASLDLFAVALRR